MSIFARSLLAAALVAGSAGIASAQGYAEPELEPKVEWSSPATAWSGYEARRAYGHAGVRRVATPHVVMRGHVAPALPPVVATAYTLPTRIIDAEPVPRTIYYNEPVIIDGLRTHRAARRVSVDPCGYGCVRSAY